MSDRNRTVRLALAAVIASAPALYLQACSTDFGGDFFPSKRSNVTSRGFVTVAAAGQGQTGGATGATGGGASSSTSLVRGTGSSQARNGGTEGPDGGNVTQFTVQFDPFPGGADVLLGFTQAGASFSSIDRDNRTTPVFIEVDIIGHDVNNNVFSPAGSGDVRRLVTYLSVTGRHDPAAQGAGGAGGGGGGAGGATVQSGEQIFTLRPTFTELQLTTGTQSTTITSGTNQTDVSSTSSVTDSIREAFPTQVGLLLTITNGVSFIIEEISLRYFDEIPRVDPVTGRDIPGVFTSGINSVRVPTFLFLEANPIASGFSTTSGGGGGQ